MAILRGGGAELNLDVYWNVIFGFPHEQASDYDVNLSVMKLITHLRPPDACAQIRLDRFSPNFADWQTLGFSAIRPLPAYKHIFPFDEGELSRFAYYFAHQHAKSNLVHELGRPLEDFADLWRDKSKAGENGSLAVLPCLGGGFILVDTRFNFEKSKLALNPIELELVLQCDAPIGLHRAIVNAATTCESTVEKTQTLFDALVLKWCAVAGSLHALQFSG